MFSNIVFKIRTFGRKNCFGGFGIFFIFTTYRKSGFVNSGRPHVDRASGPRVMLRLNMTLFGQVCNHNHIHSELIIWFGRILVAAGRDWISSNDINAFILSRFAG